jgi:hypothetical protein
MRLMRGGESAFRASEDGSPRGLLEESLGQQWDVVERDGVVIVAPVGVLPDPAPALLAKRLETRVADRPVIIDLSAITLVSPELVVHLAGWVLGARRQPGRCCVVCAPATARALLRRWHITRCLAVFGSVGDALQARRFADDGYGTGWHPRSPAGPGSARPDPSVDDSRAIVHFAPH